MSPRRRIEPGEATLFVAQPATPPRRRPLGRLPLVFTVAGLVMAAAITASTLLLISHESQRRAAMRDVSALAYVRAFMTGFTSPDPFHANDYAERVLSQATGEFEKQYREKMNDTLLQIARAQPTTGTVLDAGVERWNDDGSANVLVATKVTSRAPEGGNDVDAAFRWLVTVQQEGDQWKINNLIQVI